MATREEVMTTAERHIRRGELDVAVGLLERWTAIFPDDGPALTRLSAVRALADEERPHARSRLTVAAPLADRPTSNRQRPGDSASPIDPVSDRIRRLRALLEAVSANRRRT